MGWLFMPFSSMGGHKSAKAYLDAQLTYERTQEDGIKRGLRVLASSCPRNRTYYAAAQELVDGVPVLTVKAMTGATSRHDTVTVNAIVSLFESRGDVVGRPRI